MGSTWYRLMSLKGWCLKGITFFKYHFLISSIFLLNLLHSSPQAVSHLLLEKIPGLPTWGGSSAPWTPITWKLDHIQLQIDAKELVLNPNEKSTVSWVKTARCSNSHSSSPLANVIVNFLFIALKASTLCRGEHFFSFFLFLVRATQFGLMWTMEIPSIEFPRWR